MYTHTFSHTRNMNLEKRKTQIEVKTNKNKKEKTEKIRKYLSKMYKTKQKRNLFVCKANATYMYVFLSLIVIKPKP